MADPTFTLDLLDLETEVFAVAGHTAVPGLETLPAGNSMTEVGASAIGPGFFVCSCCCCICGA
jgi:hypothetical protein